MATSTEQNGYVSPASGEAGAEKLGRILIVEDDYFVATDLEQTLEGAGYEVVGIAASAEEAIRLGEATKPDLAIMDIRLAGIRDGIDAAIELQVRFGMPSLFASAHGDDNEIRKRAEKARPVGWLTKPYSPKLAVATIGRILNK